MSCALLRLFPACACQRRRRVRLRPPSNAGAVAAFKSQSRRGAAAAAVRKQSHARLVGRAAPGCGHWGAWWRHGLWRAWRPLPAGWRRAGAALLGRDGAFAESWAARLSTHSLLLRSRTVRGIRLLVGFSWVLAADSDPRWASVNLLVAPPASPRRNHERHDREAGGREDQARERLQDRVDAAHLKEVTIYIDDIKNLRLKQLTEKVADLCDLQPTPASMVRLPRKEMLKELRGEPATGAVDARRSSRRWAARCRRRR